MRYRYYVSTAAIQGRRAEAGSIARVSAGEIEALVLATLIQQLSDNLPDGAQGRRALFKQIELQVIVRGQALEVA